MILPSDVEDRARLYRNIVRECDVSRDERRARARQQRTWYLTGTEGGEPSRYNKLDEHVDASAAFLFAPESVRFGVVVPPRYGDRYLEEVEVARDELHRVWHDGSMGMVIALAVEWAHVYDSVAVKVLVSDGEARPMLLPDTTDLTVWNESLDSLDEQEALVHHYDVSLPGFYRLTAGLPTKRRDALRAMAESHASPPQEAGAGVLPASVTRLILTAASPSMQGAVGPMVYAMPARAQVREPVIEMAELWVRDDALGDGQGDYRVVTMMPAADEVLWEPANSLTPGEQPFRLLTLKPVPGYLWGLAQIDNLTGLQETRSKRFGGIDVLLDRQTNPPLAFIGFSGLSDEKAKAYRNAGSVIVTPNPNADVKPLAPQMPPDAFGELNELDRMFANAAGLPLLLSQGDQQPGVRSGGQVGVLATIGSARIRKRAMLVETFTSSIATAVLRLHRRMSTDMLTVPEAEGRKFLLSEIPAELVALVSAHSSSPLYAEVVQGKADRLLEKGAIGLDDYVMLTEPPLWEILRAKARRRMKAQAERGEKMLELKTKEADAKMLKAQK